MSISDKLITIAENQQLVYDAGFNAGKSQGGDDTLFWDIFQNYGDTDGVVYNYAFGYDKFSDDTYNPIHAIIGKKDTNTGSTNIFASNELITDTKVDIHATTSSNGASSLNGCFNGCTALVTIKLLKVVSTTTYEKTFVGCSNLESIKFNGTIGKSISFADSPKLSYESLVGTGTVPGIITRLKTNSSSTKPILTLHPDAAAKLTEDDKATITTTKNWDLVF